jgi:S-adenosylhomocysteine hydrolase
MIMVSETLLSQAKDRKVSNGRSRKYQFCRELTTRFSNPQPQKGIRMSGCLRITTETCHYQDQTHNAETEILLQTSVQNIGHLTWKTFSYKT